MTAVDGLRLFVAALLPDDALRGVVRLQQELKRRAPAQVVRWVRPESIHLTVRFLGAVGKQDVEPMERAVTVAVSRHAPFALHLEGVGAFKGRGGLRVIWAGLSGDVEAAAALSRDLSLHLEPLGFPPERRPFRPHLTLGRVRDGATRGDTRAIGEALRDCPPADLVEFRVDTLSLMRSHLGPGGARYETLQTVSL